LFALLNCQQYLNGHRLHANSLHYHKANAKQAVGANLSVTLQGLMPKFFIIIIIIIKAAAEFDSSCIRTMARA
jgi:hypothetical protein